MGAARMPGASVVRMVLMLWGFGAVMFGGVVVALILSLLGAPLPYIAIVLALAAGAGVSFAHQVAGPPR